MSRRQAVPPGVDVSVKVTVVPGVMLVWSAVKLTVEVASTVTVIVAVLDPYRFVAFIVTVYVPAVVNVWFSGSWAAMCVARAVRECPRHDVGLPPEVSRNSTSNGAMPEIEFGAETE